MSSREKVSTVFTRLSLRLGEFLTRGVGGGEKKDPDFFGEKKVINSGGLFQRKDPGEDKDCQFSQIFLQD